MDVFLGKFCNYVDNLDDFGKNMFLCLGVKFLLHTKFQQAILMYNLLINL